ncbi:MAG: GNAT family N-acetyltransferase [Acidobacteriota bacterium]
MKPLLRPMEARDTGQVIALEQRSGMTPWRASHYDELMSAAASICLVAEGAPVVRIVGCILGRIALPEMEIYKLVVDSSCRRRGLGHEMLVHSLNLGRSLGADTCFLEVRESNLAAQSFYRALGFEHYGLRPTYYTGPVEAAVLMRLHL